MLKITATINAIKAFPTKIIMATTTNSPIVALSFNLSFISFFMLNIGVRNVRFDISRHNPYRKNVFQLKSHIHLIRKVPPCSMEHRSCRRKLFGLVYTSCRG